MLFAGNSAETALAKTLSNYKNAKNQYGEIEECRKQLVNSEKEVHFEDVGSGSRVGVKSKARKISNIAKNSLSQPKYCLFLAEYVHQLGAKEVLELGTSLGIMSSYMAKRNTIFAIHTVEGAKPIAEIAKQIHITLGLENIQIHSKLIADFLKNDYPKIQPKIVFVDGHHDGEATKNYFNTLVSHTNLPEVIILDDIFWSEGMFDAWEEIQQHKCIKTIIETQKWGILVLDNNPAKKTKFSVWL